MSPREPNGGPAPTTPEGWAEYWREQVSGLAELQGRALDAEAPPDVIQAAGVTMCAYALLSIALELKAQRIAAAAAAAGLAAELGELRACLDRSHGFPVEIVGGGR